MHHEWGKPKSGAVSCTVGTEATEVTGSGPQSKPQGNGAVGASDYVLLGLSYPLANLVSSNGRDLVDHDL